MATTLNLISKQTVGSAGASSITFSNIPQTYTDLVVLLSARDDNSANDFDTVNIQFNADTGNNYSNIRLYGNGASTASYSNSNEGFLRATYIPCDGQTANTFSSQNIYIPNYAGSNYKSVSVDGVDENNATTAAAALLAGKWNSTSAITSIKLYVTSYNFKQYTTAYLYGVSNSSTQNTSVPYATGGDVITTDGTYWYHAFKYSGTFTPLKGLSCDYLVVAGGGGGGNEDQANEGAGGGGAGGLRSTVTATGGGGSLESALSLTANTGYTVTIGAGGAGGAVGPAGGTGNKGTSGSNSVFSSITSTGGGGGGADRGNASGLSGGSGGGAGGYGTAGTGTANQGYNGGAWGSDRGGGGGGAGAAGATGTASANGGAGVSISALATATVTGVSNYYAGGGGGGGAISGSTTGGSGGSGGGGKGGNSEQAGTAATANTGSGGGGAGANSLSGGYVGGNGGSGIVIVRYAV